MPFGISNVLVARHKLVQTPHLSQFRNLSLRSLFAVQVQWDVTVLCDWQLRQEGLLRFCGLCGFRWRNGAVVVLLQEELVLFDGLLLQLSFFLLLKFFRKQLSGWDTCCFEKNFGLQPAIRNL